MPRRLNAGSFTPQMKQTLSAVLRKAWGIEKDQRPGPVRMRFNPHENPYQKTFRYDPKTGEVWEAKDRPGKGKIAARLFGTQMRYGDLWRRKLPDGTFEVSRFTHTEARKLGTEWTQVWSLSKLYHNPTHGVGCNCAACNPTSGFRCMECGARIPVGRKRCPKCGSYDVDLANPGAAWHRQREKDWISAAALPGNRDTDSAWMRGTAYGHKESIASSLDAGMPNPARKAIAPLLLIGGLGLIIWLANRK